jgi:hypothetical protein
MMAARSHKSSLLAPLSAVYKSLSRARHARIASGSLFTTPYVPRSWKCRKNLTLHTLQCSMSDSRTAPASSSRRQKRWTGDGERSSLPRHFRTIRRCVHHALAESLIVQWLSTLISQTVAPIVLRRLRDTAPTKSTHTAPAEAPLAPIIPTTSCVCAK